MRFFSPGIMALVAGYTLSQFYRAFLAVLSKVLNDEIGAAPDALAVSSGLWFVGFAAMQIPVGAALDRFGPRRTVAVLLALGGAGGAAVFAMATQVWHIHLAMTLLGVGCAPVLMGSYYIFAREFPATAFGALAGAVIGIGSLGNILGATPLVALVEAIGWRPTLWAAAVLTLVVAAAVWLMVRDPARLDASHPQGSLSELLAIRALWLILPLFAVNYAASAAIRGLWVGPYLADVYGASEDVIGYATLMMGLAMIAGNFLIGPAVRAAGGLRRAILMASGATVVTLAVLALAPAAGLIPAVILLALVGLSGAGFVLVMSQGRAFLPPHLVGRGVTFFNMFSIGGVGLMQFGSRPVYAWAASGGPDYAYAMLFAFFALPLAVALLIFTRMSEPQDD
ncbi:MAG: MFS transporter [Paracoccus sp. (in: a-proteobacteria)]|nr:MFS transporter [Paracoccus sp. (in: a-proteobacteria)]